MAGKAMRGESTTQDLIVYRSIDKDELRPIMTRDFFWFLQKIDPYHIDKTFELVQVNLYERTLLSYLQAIGPSFVDEDIIKLYRGSKMIPYKPGTNPIDKEEFEFWIVEPKEVNKIIKLYPLFDFEEMKKYIPKDYYDLIGNIKNSNNFLPRSFQEYQNKVIAIQKKFFNYIIPNLEKNKIILCSFEQS